MWCKSSWLWLLSRKSWLKPKKTASQLFSQGLPLNGRLILSVTFTIKFDNYTKWMLYAKRASLHTFHLETKWYNENAFMWYWLYNIHRMPNQRTFAQLKCTQLFTSTEYNVLFLLFFFFIFIFSLFNFGFLRSVEFSVHLGRNGRWINGMDPKSNPKKNTVSNTTQSNEIMHRTSDCLSHYSMCIDCKLRLYCVSIFISLIAFASYIFHSVCRAVFVLNFFISFCLFLWLFFSLLLRLECNIYCLTGSRILRVLFSD